MNCARLPGASGKDSRRLLISMTAMSQTTASRVRADRRRSLSVSTVRTRNGRDVWRRLQISARASAASGENGLSFGKASVRRRRTGPGISGVCQRRRDQIRPERQPPKPEKMGILMPESRAAAPAKNPVMIF